MTPTVPSWEPTCQRQAVPLINPKAPYVGTGMEYQAAHDSGAAVIAQYDGKVTYADADKVEVRREDGSLDVYHIQNSVVQTQVLLITNVRLLKLVMSLKKAISSLTGLLWKMEKWRLDKTQSLPT